MKRFELIDTKTGKKSYYSSTELWIAFYITGMSGIAIGLALLIFIL